MSAGDLVLAARRSALHTHSGCPPLLSGSAAWKSTGLRVGRPELLTCCVTLVRFSHLWALGTLTCKMRGLTRWDANRAYKEDPAVYASCSGMGGNGEAGHTGWYKYKSLELSVDVFPYTHLTSLKVSSIWVNLSYTRVACSPTDGFSSLLFYFIFLSLRDSSSSTRL